MIKFNISARMTAVGAISLLIGIALPVAGYAHDDHVTFSAGAPGDPKKPSRIIEIRMGEGVGKMHYRPDKLVIDKGDQIRFVLKNVGLLPHEFVLATTAENLRHAEEMKRFPDMEHDDPNAKRIEPGKTGEIIWRFTKSGEFEFGCLIPGHREAGMIGKITVK